MLAQPLFRVEKPEKSLFLTFEIEPNIMISRLKTFCTTINEELNRAIYCNAHAHRYDLEISWWLSSSSNGLSV